MKKENYIPTFNILTKKSVKTSVEAKSQHEKLQIKMSILILVPTASKPFANQIGAGHQSHLYMKCTSC